LKARQAEQYNTATRICVCLIKVRQNIFKTSTDYELYLDDFYKTPYGAEVADLSQFLPYCLYALLLHVPEYCGDN
jgi:hypothetical protein